MKLIANFVKFGKKKVVFGKKGIDFTVCS